MKKKIFCVNTLIVFLLSFTTVAQTNEDIVRIEFNAGTRAYREQVILTPDSVVTIKENFRKDEKPVVASRVVSDAEWRNVLNSFTVSLAEVSNLKSATNKRAHDGASHGSIIITTKNGQSVSHNFDDEEPHEAFQPLMKQIRKVTNRESKSSKKEKSK